MFKKVSKISNIEIKIGFGTITHEFPEGASVVGVASNIIKYSGLSNEELEMIGEALHDAIEVKKNDN